ncbi:MAG: hypothetical protein WBE27_01965 [Microgenomates group bacterium]
MSLKNLYSLRFLKERRMGKMEVIFGLIIAVLWVIAALGERNQPKKYDLPDYSIAPIDDPFWPDGWIWMNGQWVPDIPLLDMLSEEW